MGDADASSPLYVLWLGEGAATVPRAQVAQAAHDLSADEIAALVPDLVVASGPAIPRAIALGRELARVRSDVAIPVVPLEAGATLSPALLEPGTIHEGRCGLLIGDTAVVMDADGRAAPDRGAVHGGALRFVWRAPGRIKILRRDAPSEQIASASLDGARIVFIGVGAPPKDLEERGAQVTVLEEPEPNAARAADPTVIVLAARALSSSTFALALADDARLASASLLVVDGEVGPETIAAVAGALAQREAEVAARVAKGTLVLDRIEALGVARWLKVASRAEQCVLSLRARGGIGEVQLAAGKIREATFTSSTPGADEQKGRAAIQEILALPAGTVLLGSNEDVERGRPKPRAQPLEAKASPAPEKAAQKVPSPRAESKKDAKQAATAVPKPSAAPEPEPIAPRESSPDLRRHAPIGDPLWAPARKPKAADKRERKSKDAKAAPERSSAAPNQPKPPPPERISAAPNQPKPPPPERISAPPTQPKPPDAKSETAPATETKPASDAKRAANTASETKPSSDAKSAQPASEAKPSTQAKPVLASVPKPGAASPAKAASAKQTLIGAAVASDAKTEAKTEAKPFLGVPGPSGAREAKEAPSEATPAATKTLPGVAAPPPEEPKPSQVAEMQPSKERAPAKVARRSEPAGAGYEAPDDLPERRDADEAPARGTSPYVWLAVALAVIGLGYVVVRYAMPGDEAADLPPETSQPPAEDEPLEPEPSADLAPDEPIEPVADVEPPPEADTPAPEPTPEPPAAAPSDLLAELEQARTSRDWPRIQRAAERVLATDDRNAQAAYFLALAHSKQYHYAEAQQAVRRAIELQPADGDPLLLEGDIHRRFGRRSRAVAAWTECVRLHPRFAACRERLDGASNDVPDEPPPSE